MLQALRELELEGMPALFETFLPVLKPYSNLTCLCLSGSDFDYGDIALESHHLCSLPQLAKLKVSDWHHVILEGTTPLPNLQHLEISSAGGLVLNSELPRLHTLDIYFMEHNAHSVDFLRVGGNYLQLPALTHLCLLGDFNTQAEVHLQRLTTVQAVSLNGSVLLDVDGLAPLHHLASLALECHCPAQQWAAVKLLHSAPHSLRRLELKLRDWEEEDIPLEPGLAAALGVCTFLTALKLHCSTPVPAQLVTLSRLECLTLGKFLENLTVVETARLGQLRQLRHLVLRTGKVPAGQEATVQGALQVIAAVEGGWDSPNCIAAAFVAFQLNCNGWVGKQCMTLDGCRHPKGSFVWWLL